MSQLVKTKRQANFKGFKRFGAFKGLVEQKCQFPLGNLVITEVLPTKSLDGHSQLGPKNIVNALYLYFTFYK
jgi:hypothetical protein